MSGLERAREAASDVASRVADSLRHDIYVSLKNELNECLVQPELTRDMVFELAAKIAREHVCRRLCDCRSEIAMDLEQERMR